MNGELFPEERERERKRQKVRERERESERLINSSFREEGMG